MMKEVEILSAEKVGEWNGERGTFDRWKADLRDVSNGAVYRGATGLRKPGNSLLTNTRIHIELKGDESAGWKFSVKQPQDSGGGASGGGRTWKPRSPSETAAIQRQHSQEMALRACSIWRPSSTPWNHEELQAAIRDWTDWFDADIKMAVERAEAGGAPPPPQQLPAPKPKAPEQPSLDLTEGQAERADEIKRLFKEYVAVSPDPAKAKADFQLQSNALGIFSLDGLDVSAADDLIAWLQARITQQPTDDEKEKDDIPF